MAPMPDTDPPPLWTAARRELVRAEALRWAGTPHANRIAVPGQGVDCVRFVFELLTVAKVCDPFPISAYDGRLGALRNVNVMEGILVEYFNAHSVCAGPPEFGDVAVFTCGDRSNHVGLCLDGGEVWHVPGKGRVGPEAWANVTKKLQGLVRFDAPGFREGMDPGKLTWAEIKARKDATA